jgi:hypothetical protein
MMWLMLLRLDEGDKMKFTFETEDEQEALMYSSAPQFYAALYKIRELLRQQEKYGFTLSIETPVSQSYVVSALKEKINQIIYDEAPSFHQII